MKRLLSVLLALMLCAVGCAAPDVPDSAKAVPVEPIDLTLCIYPVGAWGNSSTVAALLNDFRRDHPEINLHIQYVKYDNGDALIEEAIANGTAPDLVLEGPERLVANWGARGLMADLSDLMDSPEAREIDENTRNACCSADGKYYAFPLCMTPHCMAVNYDLFRASGAAQYLDEETRTWTTEGFVQAVNALYAYGQTEIAAVYCNGQGGDQGTRALVNNLYGGSFTDPQHTCYTFHSAENIQALTLLRSLPGIRFDPTLAGGDEITQFCSGKLAMAFCWNVAIEIQQVIGNPELTFEVLPMAFPTNTGAPRLQDGIWGFGIFDNGDPQRLAAAKEFIRYMTTDDRQYRRAVLASTYWPVRPVKDIYINDELMEEYSVLMPYIGDYYQITPGWSGARTAWWEMLQSIAGGADPAAAAQKFDVTANAAAVSSAPHG